MAAIRLGFPRLLAALQEFSRFSDLLPPLDSPSAFGSSSPVVAVPSVVASSSDHHSGVGLTAVLTSLDNGTLLCPWPGGVGSYGEVDGMHSHCPELGLFLLQPISMIDGTDLGPRSGGRYCYDEFDTMKSYLYMVLRRALSHAPDPGLLALVPLSMVDGVRSGGDVSEDLKDQHAESNLEVGASGSGGAGGGGDDDDDEYLKLLRLLLELCSEAEVDIDKFEFSPVKFHLLKQWHRLHVKRLSLEAASKIAESDKERIAREWQKIKTELEKIDKMLRDLAKEKELVLRADIVSRRDCKFNGCGRPACQFDDTRLYLLLREVLDYVKPKDETPAPGSLTTKLKTLYQKVSKIMRIGGKLSPFVAAFYLYYVTGLTRTDFWHFYLWTIEMRRQAEMRDFEAIRADLEKSIENKPGAINEPAVENMPGPVSDGGEEKSTPAIENKPGAFNEVKAAVENTPVSVSDGGEEKSTPAIVNKPGAVNGVKPSKPAVETNRLGSLSAEGEEKSSPVAVDEVKTVPSDVSPPK